MEEMDDIPHIWIGRDSRDIATYSIPDFAILQDIY